MRHMFRGHQQGPWHVVVAKENHPLNYPTVQCSAQPESVVCVRKNQGESAHKAASVCVCVCVCVCV